MTKRVYDSQGRWRNKRVCVRMSPEEDELLEAKVRLSGLTKQDYVMKRLLEKEVVVIGNPRVYRALWEQMEEIHKELVRIGEGEKPDPDLLEILCLVSDIYKGMKEETKDGR